MIMVAQQKGVVFISMSSAFKVGCEVKSAVRVAGTCQFVQPRAGCLQFRSQVERKKRHCRQP